MPQTLPIPVLERLFRAAERRTFSLSLALSAPAWVALVRMLLERFLSVGTSPTGRPPMPWFAHIFGFYLALYLTLGAVLVLVAKIDWKRALQLMAMGLVLGTLPPFIDAAISGRGGFSYEYQPGLAHIPWSLHQPPRVLPWGETLVLWTTVLLMAVATLRATRSAFRAAAAGVVTYACVLLFLVLLPELSVRLSGDTGVAPSEWRNLVFCATAMSSTVVALGLSRRFLARLPHVLLAPLFVLAGAALKGTPGGAAVMTAVQFGLASAGFALANDFYDRAEDEAQGRRTTLDREGAQLLALVPLTYALHFLSLRLEVGLSLLGFAVVAHAYHADPFRLKCVFPLSYKTEGLLGGLAFIAGLTAAPEVQPTTPQLWVALFVTLGTPVALVFKDFKDVDGDAAAGVRTAFVVAEARGWARSRVRWLSAGLLGLALAVPTAWLAQASPVPVAPQWLGALAALAVIAPLALCVLRRPALAVGVAMVGAELFLSVFIAALTR